MPLWSIFITRVWSAVTEFAGEGDALRLVQSLAKTFDLSPSSLDYRVALFIGEFIGDVVLAAESLGQTLGAFPDFHDLILRAPPESQPSCPQ